MMHRQYTVRTQRDQALEAARIYEKQYKEQSEKVGLLLTGCHQPTRTRASARAHESQPLLEHAALTLCARARSCARVG
jgi:hypothetical protein